MLDRPTFGRPHLRFVNDGGHDAPIDERTDRGWWLVALVIVTLALALTIAVMIVE